jgi:hypothetical protein
MELKDLFPRKFFITEEIIKKANLSNVSNCIGALSLKESLKNVPEIDQEELSWGSYSGSNTILGCNVWVGTQEGINLMNVTEPQEITFIIDLIDN